MRRVEWVTDHVRWRKERGGGLKGVVVVVFVVDGDEGEEYLEGRRMVMGSRGVGVAMFDLVS